MLTATLIGDVVASRRASDRAGLHGRLTELLDSVNATWAPSTPLRITIGDEFQGAFATVGQAPRVDPPRANARVAKTPESRDWPMGGRTGDRNPVSPEKNAPTEWAVPIENKKGKNIRWSARVGSVAIGVRNRHEVDALDADHGLVPSG